MPWEETENEISHRVRDPGDFQTDSFRRMTIKRDRPQVFAIIGKLKGQTTTTVQALRFPKRQGWTMAKAKDWVAKHYKAGDIPDEEMASAASPPAMLPMQALSAELAPVQSENGDRIAELSWYTGATVRRRGWDCQYLLTLSMNPEHVRMERLTSGKAPLLNSHSDYRLNDVIGVVQSASLNGKARVRFSKRADVDPIWNDVQDGIIRNASVGALIYKLKDITEKDEDGNEKTKAYLAVDWEPLEVSLVPIGADRNAGFQAAEEVPSRVTEVEIVSADEQGAVEARMEGATMPEKKETDAGEKTRNEQQQENLSGKEKPKEAAATASQGAADDTQRQAGITAERARVKAIRETTEACGLEASFGSRHVDLGTSIEDYRKIAIDERARRNMQQVPSPTPPADVNISQASLEESETRRVAMTGALLERFEPGKWKFDERDSAYVYVHGGRQKLHEPARQFVGVSLLDCAKECLAARGIRWQSKNRTEIVTLAFQSTSDFPSILANVANKSLRAGYEMSESQWKLIAARRTAPDFKQVSELTLDASSRLEKVPESGEFKRGKLIEGKEVWQLSTYGKIIAITRQAIINDDLGAFTRTPFLLGQEVAMLEADTVIGIITANGNLSDGVALFEKDTHKNYIDVGAAIAIDSLGAARVKLMTQLSTGGKPLNTTPRFLLAPAAIGTVAEQYCSAAYQAVTAATVNPLAGRLTPIIESRLDPVDANDWYLFGDPNTPNGTVLVYGYLEGQEGPYTENRQGFDVDGVEVKIRHDFGAAAVDYRGAVKHAGA